MVDFFVNVSVKKKKKKKSDSFKINQSIFVFTSRKKDDLIPAKHQTVFLSLDQSEKSSKTSTPNGYKSPSKFLRKLEFQIILRPF